jgi:vacuolar-type H+-ATPase subunit H
MFNIKKNHKDKLYLLKRESSETSLFGDMITKGMVDAINKAVKLDYKQKVLFDFCLPNNGTKFYRHYTSEPQENYAVIHVGVFNSVYRYASVVINLTNERQEPYLLILDYDAISGDDKIVAQMVEKTLNWPFKGKAEHIRLEEREADDEYKRMIEFARKESDLIISKAEKKKNELIHEAHLVAEEDKKKIIEEGKYKVKIMKADAERENEKLEKQLKEERIDSVKQTSKKVVKRLLKHNKELSDDYF